MLAGMVHLLLGKRGDCLHHIKISWEDLAHKTHLAAWLRRERSTADYIRSMYPRENKEKVFSVIWGRRFAAMLLLSLTAIFAACFCYFSEPENGRLKDGKYIARGEEDEVVELEVLGENEKSRWQKGLSVNVRERQFSSEEMKQLEERTDAFLKKSLPGENESAEQIKKPLFFAKTVPETGISLTWTYEADYIRDTGALRRNAIPKDGVKTEVMARAQWKNWNKCFTLTVFLMPEEPETEEAEMERAKKAIKEVMKKTADKEVVTLPEAVGDTKLQYREKEGGKDYTLFILCLFAVFLYPVCVYQKQKKDLEKREQQMLLDHPALVNRVMLLLGAGLTVRKAVERLADEYLESRKNGGEIRYVYEEICVMVQEMRDGVAEGRSIEHFGKRCRLLPYLRFSSVLAQNLKKGADGILDILEKESLEALEKRKERVLQMGETAGTRLLFPMIIMLGLVMAIIMVPAFMTM